MTKSWTTATTTGMNSVPTPAVLGGDFTGMQNIYDPTTQTIAHDINGNPYPVRQSFASEYANGNTIPSTLIDSVALRHAELLSHADQPPSWRHICSWKRTVPRENCKITSTPASSNPPPIASSLAGWITTSLPSNRLTMSDTQSDTPVVYPNQVTVCPIGCQIGRRRQQ